MNSVLRRNSLANANGFANEMRKFRPRCGNSLRMEVFRRDYHQSFVQPDFRAEKKGALSGGFLLIFLCLRPKRAPKSLRQTLVTSDTHVSLVKVLPKVCDKIR